MILGGAQENTLLSAVGTRRSAGWSCALVTGPSTGPEGRLLELAREEDVPVHLVPCLVRAPHPLLDPLALVHLWWLCVRLRPAVVHTHSSKAGILGRLAARLAGVPVVVHTIHGLPFHPYQSRGLYRLYVLMERLAARFADRLVGVASAMCETALAAGVGYPRQYQVVHSGMEVGEFLRAKEDAARQLQTRARYGLGPEDQVLIMVARLFELKGHDDLLAVAPTLAARLPRLRVVLVGDGLRRQELQRRVEELQLGDRVVFTGLVPPQEIALLLAASDLLVHTSLREGLARVLPKALLAGTAVLSYDVDGAREVVRHRETGVLLPPGDLEGLATWCQTLLQQPDLASRLTRAGLELCRHRFAAPVMVRDLLQLYSELLRGCRQVDATMADP